VGEHEWSDLLDEITALSLERARARWDAYPKLIKLARAVLACSGVNDFPRLRQQCIETVRALTPRTHPKRRVEP